MACPNRCDAGKIAREDVATHVSQLCPAGVVPCQFREMGCKHVVGYTLSAVLLASDATAIGLLPSVP